MCEGQKRKKEYQANVRNTVESFGITCYWPTFKEAALWVASWPEAIAANIQEIDNDT